MIGFWCRKRWRKFIICLGGNFFSPDHDLAKFELFKVSFPCNYLSPSYTHTHTHTLSLLRAHTLSHSFTHKHIHTTNTNTLSHIHTLSLTHTHTLFFIHTYSLTHTCTQTDATGFFRILFIKVKWTLKKSELWSWYFCTFFQRPFHRCYFLSRKNYSGYEADKKAEVNIVIFPNQIFHKILRKNL